MNARLLRLLVPALAIAGFAAPSHAQQDAPTAEATDSAPSPAEASKADDPTIVYTVDLRGTYMDLAEAGGDLTSLLMGGGPSKPKSFYDMLGQIESLAKKDGDRVMFDLTNDFTLDLPQLAELERAMRTVRKSGKKCIAYLENAGPTEYQVAALCDEILMADLGTIDLPSIAMSVTFMKDALDLLGVKFDVVRCGDFKGAVEPYVLSSMSKHLRDHYSRMLEHLNHDVARRIATHRDLGTARVRELQAQRMFSARQALEAGLIDRIVPWRGADHALGVALDGAKFVERPGLQKESKRKNFNPMAFLSQMFKQTEEAEVEDDSIVVLHLSGQIVDGSKAVPGSIVSGPTVQSIQKLIDNDAVKGVVVRVNSPGGSATASEAILLALQDLSAKKPVVVSMGRLAASGGYYVTCLGRPILAEAGTITGSIGVFGMKPAFGALMRRIGVHEEMIALDEAAKMMSMSENWSDEQKALVQNHVDEIYDVFVGHVAQSRGMPANDVLKIAGGRVWSGEQAVANGLVDKIGGLEDAIGMIAKEAGIEDYEVEHRPSPRNFMDAFAEELMNVRIGLDDSIERAAIKRLNLDSALRIVLDALQNEQPTRVWALMPEPLTIR
ncbi:MAG: signal peptide peptidase SppA [Planctomycetes bacterium]|nr:signal peptide peptidase SppA [Planctomycetota bacterium]